MNLDERYQKEIDRGSYVVLARSHYQELIHSKWLVLSVFINLALAAMLIC